MIDSKIKSYLDRLAGAKNRPGSYIFVGQNENENFSSAKNSAVWTDKLAGKEEAAFYFISKIAEKYGNSAFLERMKSKNHPDVVIVEPEIEEKKGKIREKEIGISQIREALERLKFFPYEIKTKFCLVRRAQKMNAESANALLKSLEEPSEKAIFVLLANDVESILPTIVSRCAILRFPQKNISRWDEENRDQFKKLIQGEIFERFGYIEKLSKDRGDMGAVLADWEKIMAQSLRNMISTAGEGRKIRKVVEMVEEVQEAMNRLERTNASARAVGEEVMLNI